MAWITTESGKHINTEWFDKDRQIEANKKQADELNKDDDLRTAIEAYTAQGGQQASKHPFTLEKKKLLEEALSHNNYETQEDIFRGISVSAKQWEKMFNDMYDGKAIDVNLSGLQSFTKDRTRSFGYGSGEQKIIYRIEKGTKVFGKDISGESIYKEEKEVLLANNKMKASYDDIEFRDNGTVILTLHGKED